MFEIIGTESCPKQNQALSEKSSIPWTHCFRQRPKESEEPRKQERFNAHLKKFRFLQYLHKEFACGFKTFLCALER